MGVIVGGGPWGTRGEPFGTRGSSLNHSLGQWEVIVYSGCSLND